MAAGCDAAMGGGEALLAAGGTALPAAETAEGGVVASSAAGALLVGDVTGAVGGVAADASLSAPVVQGVAGSFLSNPLTTIGTTLMAHPAVAAGVAGLAVVGASELAGSVYASEGPEQADVAVCHHCGGMFPHPCTVQQISDHEQVCQLQEHASATQALHQFHDIGVAKSVDAFRRHLAGGVRVETPHDLGHIHGANGTHLGYCILWDGEQKFGILVVGSKCSGLKEVLVEVVSLTNCTELRVGDAVSLKLVSSKLRDGLCKQLCRRVRCSRNPNKVLYAKTAERLTILTPLEVRHTPGIQFDCWQDIFENSSLRPTTPPTLQNLLQHVEIVRHSFHDHGVMVENRGGDRFRLSLAVLPSGHLEYHVSKLLPSRSVPPPVRERGSVAVQLPLLG
mmetsp:Transcript_1732/g.4351  ORF Transcript_1732/g.4351 Transcript_1732/m.4351 type:complete len:394 (-) Transcript_1732:140-1321(-)|eukprot:CAMPEP_0115215980 /NCGR_PEP_ID=MMETSP0270-20121206/25102_1 /TAXON_ID=71861 /ORGANISM="Scrippsiella trochoidea, Strain CCMP3099" /LENGTH=393 /DNA_ID=CAMNT_0002629803 /DNA_START=121 /DNA_END=1302 /DNA_ORIENTATION=-